MKLNIVLNIKQVFLRINNLKKEKNKINQIMKNKL